MSYQYSNQLWNLAGFKDVSQTISELDSKLFIVSELLINFPSDTSCRQLVYNEENYRKLDEIFENLEVIENNKKSKSVFGTQQVISEPSPGYFVNNPLPIVGDSTPVVGLISNETIFTWGYDSTDRPDIKNIQTNSNYIAQVPFTHITTGSNIKVGVTVMAKEDITTSLSFNVNLYRQVLDIEGRVEKTLISNLGTVAVDGTVDTEQIVSIREGHYAQSFVNLSIAGQTDSGASVGVGDAEGGVRPEIGGRTNSSSLNIGSFTNPNFSTDNPITFLNNSKVTNLDFTVSGTPASSVSYFIGLENKDEVGTNGTGVVVVNTIFETPGGGLNPWCEFFNYSNGTHPNLVTVMNCWNFTDNT
jgi:hypothetical protein